MESEQSHRRFPLGLIKDFYEKHRGKITIAKFVLVFGLGVIVSLILFRSGGETPTANGVEVPPTSAQAEGPTMWTCSMHPQIRQPKPGSCPICGMDLIPVAKSSGGMRTLGVSAEARALMNIQTAPVERRYVTKTIQMVGKVDYDETTLGFITAWVPGRLDRLYVDYTGVEVKKGDHMVYIYSEELYSAQEELIQALKYQRDRPSSTTTLIRPINLVDSAREKLRLLGLTPEQIKEIELRQKPTDHVTIYSPVRGIVIEKLKQEGERVRTGDRIYTIADLRQVWVHLDAYESDLPWIKYGQEVVFTTDSYPGEQFKGRIVFIQPVLNDRTRTVKVRVNVPNLDGKLKPEMLVHGTVHANVAAAGRVMDARLAGKWISPMHPEIVKDEPGNCDICGMPLVRAETLGFVAAETDDKARPLIIPYSAALYTGKRAVVYLELPSMHGGVEQAFQNVSAAVEGGKLDKIHEAFASFSNILDQPYNQPGTSYAKNLWNDYADQLAVHALAGQRAASRQAAEQIFAKVETLMNELREQFAPPEKPTFEGREIVLGPRADDYYIVRHGLQEGQLVVTQGAFKIDSEIQIQAKPSMMTPQGGGGGGGHDHGDGGAKKSAGDEHAGHKMSLPVDFLDQVRELEAVYGDVTKAVQENDLEKLKVAFGQFGKALDAVDGEPLTGHPRMQWKEFSMLLSNDAFEGSTAKTMKDADRVYLSLKSNIRRMREQMGVKDEQQREVERIEVPPEFQKQLAGIWQAYVPIQQALAADNYALARKSVGAVQSAVAQIDDHNLSDGAKRAWQSEKKNLTKLFDKLEAAKDIKTLRTEFLPFSEEVGVLAKAFGFGDVGPVYQLHCPMAFDNRGAIWFQDHDKAKNPYYGATMLGCADRVDLIAPQEESPKQDEHKEHEGHKH